MSNHDEGRKDYLDLPLVQGHDEKSLNLHGELNQNSTPLDLLELKL